MEILTLRRIILACLLVIILFGIYQYIFYVDLLPVDYTLRPGIYQVENANPIWMNDAKVVDADDAEFGKAVKLKKVSFVAKGTEVIVRWKSDNPLVIHSDDEYVEFDPHHEIAESVIAHFRYSQLLKRTLLASVVTFDIQQSVFIEPDVFVRDSWSTATIARSTLPQTFTFDVSTLDLSTGSGKLDQSDFLIDSITVVDRTFENVYPYAAAVAIGVGMLVFVVASAVRERRK